MMAILSGMSLIAEERMRQKEKWSDEHDDKHLHGFLGRLAASYVSFAWSGLWFRTDIKKPKDDKDALIKAGALICAELDRIERLL